MCVCKRERERECVCVCAKERESARARQRERERERERSTTPVHFTLSVRTCSVRRRDLYIPEMCVSVKRGLCAWQKRPAHIAKGL